MSKLMKIKYITCFMIAVSLFTHRAIGELPPGTYGKLKKAATDKIRIKILKTETSPEKNGFTDIVFTAKVTKVTATKSGTKVGDQIKIYCSTYTGKEPFGGPSQPPILKKGWKGPAYLNCIIDKKTKKKTFNLAAYGQSFRK